MLKNLRSYSIPFVSRSTSTTTHSPPCLCRHVLPPPPSHTATTNTTNKPLFMASSQDSQTFRWHYIEFDDRNFQIGGRTFFFAVVLFAVVLLITLIFLYARWARRYRHLHSSSAASVLPHAPALPPQGLDPSTINSFSIVLHNSPATRIDEPECCICLGVFKDGEKVKVLPTCHHCYHSECVDKWLSEQPSCPLCRSSLRPDSVV